MKKTDVVKMEVTSLYGDIDSIHDASNEMTTRLNAKFGKRVSRANAALTTARKKVEALQTQVHDNREKMVKSAVLFLKGRYPNVPVSEIQDYVEEVFTEYVVDNLTLANEQYNFHGGFWENSNC